MERLIMVSSINKTLEMIDWPSFLQRYICSYWSAIMWSFHKIKYFPSILTDSLCLAAINWWKWKTDITGQHVTDIGWKDKILLSYWPIATQDNSNHTKYGLCGDSLSLAWTDIFCSGVSREPYMSLGIGACSEVSDEQHHFLKYCRSSTVKYNFILNEEQI